MLHVYEKPNFFPTNRQHTSIHTYIHRETHYDYEQNKIVSNIILINYYENLNLSLKFKSDTISLLI